MKLGFGVYRNMLVPAEMRFARQVGATHAVVHMPGGGTGEKAAQLTAAFGPKAGFGYSDPDDPLWTYEGLRDLKTMINGEGLELEGLENFAPAHWSDILLDGPRKKQQFELLKNHIRNIGRVGIPIMGYYFSLAGVNVLNLEPVLRDPRYEATTFVLIHGGYPFEQAAIFMTVRKNVWLDSSGTGSFLLSPDLLKDVLRRWFAIAPEKVTYGSDAFPMDERIGAEEIYWMAVHGARTATAAALAEMIAAREITEAQALTIARGYLHDNAVGLYK